MRIPITMQRLAPDMTTGVVVSWLVAIGDEIEVGDELVEVSADKADVAMEAMDAGTLVEIVHNTDDEVEIGAVIGWLER